MLSVVPAQAKACGALSPIIMRPVKAGLPRASFSPALIFPLKGLGVGVWGRG